MKIAHIVSTFQPYQGGMGNVAAAMQRELRALGHMCDVLTPAYGRTKAAGGDHVYRLKPLFSLGNAACLPTIGKHLNDYDIIHLHYPFFGGAEPIFFASRRLRKTGSRIILHYHMDVVGDGVRRALFALHNKILLPWMITRADAVIVTSQDYALHSNIASLVRSTPKHFFEIPNGVDAKNFMPGSKSAALLEKHGLSPDDRIVIFVGGLDRAHYFKGLEYLIEAMNQLRNAPYTWKLMIIGEGELKSKYADIVSQLNLAHRVLFTGYVPNESLPDYYRLADVAVLPSVDKSEAFGLTLIEAMACGKAVVASNLPGVRSVVDEGVNGLLAEPRNASDLASKINHLLFHPELMAQFSDAGRQKVETQYDWQRVVSAIEVVYQQVRGVTHE